MKFPLQVAARSRRAGGVDVEEDELGVVSDKASTKGVEDRVVEGGGGAGDAVAGRGWRGEHVCCDTVEAKLTCQRGAKRSNELGEGS